MSTQRKELAIRAVLAKNRLIERLANGVMCVGPYQTTDLIMVATDCVEEGMKRFYWDFAGNRMSQLVFAVDCLEALLKDGDRAVPTFGMFNGHKMEKIYMPPYVGGYRKGDRHGIEEPS